MSIASSVSSGGGRKELKRIRGSCWGSSRTTGKIGSETTDS
jgi:hypothetical protein